MLEHNAHKLKRHAVHPRCSSTNHLLFAPIMLWHFDVLRSFPTLLEFLPILHCPIFSWWENHLGSVAAPAGTEPGEGRRAVPDTGTETGDAITRLLTRLIAGLESFIAVSPPSISEADCYKRKRKNNARSPHLHPSFTLHLKKTNPDYEILNCQIFFWENYYWTWSVLIQLYKMQISGTHDSIDSTILSNTEYWILVYWILNYFGSNTILLITIFLDSNTSLPNPQLTESLGVEVFSIFFGFQCMVSVILQSTYLHSTIWPKFQQNH